MWNDGNFKQFSVNLRPIKNGLTNNLWSKIENMKGGNLE